MLIAAPSLRVKGPSLAMVTLAFGIVVEKLVTEASDAFGGAMGIYSIVPLDLFGEPFSMRQWVWFAIALCLVAHLLIRNLLIGRFGRAWLAIQADEIAASAMGVPVLRYKVLAFVIAATTCGLAGALVAQQNQYINSDFINFDLSIFILLLVMFGGSGSLAGPLVGAVTLTILDNFLARWSWIEHFANGAVLLFALYSCRGAWPACSAISYPKFSERPNRCCRRRPPRRRTCRPAQPARPRLVSRCSARKASARLTGA